MESPNSQTHHFNFWPGAIKFGSIICFTLIIYTWLYNSAFNLISFSQAVAGAAGILIGSSLALSGMGYFFDFLDSKVAYRKQLGLLGFWLALG